MTSKTTRYIRVAQQDHESRLSTVPDAGTADSDLENGVGDDGVDEDEAGLKTSRDYQSPLGTNHERESTSIWRIGTRPWRRCGRRRGRKSTDGAGCTSCKRRSPLRLVLRSLAIALMLLGLVEALLLVVGLVASFFPSEFESAYYSIRPHRPHGSHLHWPTDGTADIMPIQCHSHNDYWRPIPLKSALRAGCTGVEADVWLFKERSEEDLYVGHSRASLTQQRTFRSLYIDPLVEILERQNPNTTLHPVLDTPRNGVFDTDGSQTLVLLVDFKTDGQELWSYVSEQLEPLRKRQYLTHFNGTDVVEGPVTVVVTGNAPFNKVVENHRYRDMFFDAPLELLGRLAPPDEDVSTWNTYNDTEEATYLTHYTELTTSLRTPVGEVKTSNQGQGHSGAAPKNPAIYTPANSYYASVSFVRAVGIPLPYLSRDQKNRIRQQIRGAHKQGLKVRYWDTPGWPRGLRNYIWRVLVEEGVDYLNVDDLRGATRGNWGGPQRHRGWSLW